MLKNKNYSIVLLILISGFLVGMFVGKSKGIPFVRKQARWSIGIYSGRDPFSFTSAQNIINPVLTAADITDIPADFVADPFMVKEGSQWYMFFEVLNAETEQGDIGLACSDDGFNWTYKQIVLDEPFHLSYPYVFKWNNQYYMVPESREAKFVKLYRAVNFPLQWVFVADLLKDNYYTDSSLLRFNNKWWLFTTTGRNDILHLYYAGRLNGPWIAHPQNPIAVGDVSELRSAGRILNCNGRIIRYGQDGKLYEGKQVQAFEIIKLTTADYEEKLRSESPILKAGGSGWNKKGMHHIDPHQVQEGKWIACVDGYRVSLDFGIKY